MNKITLPLGLIVSIAAAPLHAQAVEAKGEVRAINIRDRSNPPPVGPAMERAALSENAPAGTTAPAGCHDPRYGTITLGDNKIPVIVAKASADDELPNKLFLDTNGNGKIDADEGIDLKTRSSEQRTRGGNITVISANKPGIGLTIQGAKLTADLMYSQQAKRPASITLIFTKYLHAETPIGDEPRVIAVVDSNFSGKFGDAGDTWALTKPGAKRPPSAYAMHGITEGHFENGHLTRIKVQGDKVLVDVAKADAAPAAEQAAHRARVEHIWAKRFDAEREGFLKARGMDTSRPTTKKPIAWQYLTFDEGLALSKKTGKPLFVDIMAFWCVWCYRLDYYTYPDQEVAETLNEKFIPIKIIQEQDRGNDYAKVREALGARGIPAMGIFNGDGEKLHSIGGWKKPEDFLAELNKGLKKQAKGDK